MKPLTAIMAIATDGTIGIDGKLPWSIAEDLKRFKTLTTAHAIIMGRRTFDSIGKALPHRTNIVVTHDETFGLKHKNVLPCKTPDRALWDAHQVDRSPFVIGGGEIYSQLWEDVTRIELTHVDCAFPDAANKTTFNFDREPWIQVAAQKALTDPRATFITLERRPS